MAESPVPGPSMMTQTVIKPITPQGGESIDITPATVQNRKLLPIADLVSRHTIWLLECESNNVGSVKDPKDVQNINAFKNTLERMWTRTKKFNRGGGDTQFEITHPVAFASLGELQSMPNTPARHLAYLNWHLFRTLLEKQGSKLQVFIDKAAIDDIGKAIEEIQDFIDTEFGNGSVDDANEGTYNTGEQWPDHGRLGRVVNSPMGGNVHVGEPSAALPPSVPTDTPDTP